MTKATKKTGKEVAVKQDSAVSTEFQNMFDKNLKSSGDTMDAEDFRIPKITLIQAMTKAAFNTEEVKEGNFINSMEKDDMGDTMEIFLMSDVKLWKFNYLVPQGKNKEDKKEYLTITDFSPYSEIRKTWGTVDLPAEILTKCEAKGIDPKQVIPPDLIYRFTVLLVNEVKEGIAFPYNIDFTRSSAPVGNKLKNLFFKLKKVAKLPSYAKVFELGSEFVQEEFDYYRLTCNSGRPIEKEELDAVEGWIKELSANASNYSTDESDSDSETDANTFETNAKPVDTEQEGQPKY